MTTDKKLLKKEVKEEKKIAKDLKKGGRYGNVPFSVASLPHSPYFQTVCDPFDVHGVKIPDEIQYPSSTFTVIQRRQWTLSANGGGIVAYGFNGTQSTMNGSLVPVKWTNPVNSVNDYVLGQITTGATTFNTSDVFTHGPGGLIPTQFQEWTNTSNGIPATYRKVRLVSAGVCAEYLGTLLNAKGRMTLCSTPRKTIAQMASAGPVTLNAIMNQVDVKVLPLNTIPRGIVKYKPLDNICYQYSDQQIAYDNSFGLSQNPDQPLCGEMIIVIDGAEAGATVQLTEVFNFEGVPMSGAFNIVQPTPSKSDPIELAVASNAIADVPSTSSNTQSFNGLMTGKTQIEKPTISTSGSSVHVTEPKKLATSPKGEEDSSFLDKALDVGTDLVSTFAPGIIGKMAPLAREAIKELF